MRLALSCLSTLLLGGPALAEQPAGRFHVEPVAEKKVAQLPAGPLYWRIEAFSGLAEAQASAGPLSLAVEAQGRAWLFTLGRKDDAIVGGRTIAEIGPVPLVQASEYLLRINRAGGSPGSMTPVHTHPGSEAFYVLTGRLCQRTSHGTAGLDAGKAMNGHEPGMVMQLMSCGETDLDQFVMFVVDATKPFSSPASFD